MTTRYRLALGWLGRQLRNKFLVGIIVVVPLSATIWILTWIFNSIDSILQPIIRVVWNQPVPGVGFGIAILLILLAGIIASNVIGKKFITLGEGLLDKLPLVKQLYRGIKQILVSFTAPYGTGFMQVVFIEFPRKGMQCLGFITNQFYTKSGERLFTVFIPTSPNPTSGFLEIVREEEIVRTSIPVEDALGVIVSAGRVSLETLMAKQEGFV
ncbi:MAG: DUF502 domain-containing protein [Dehalococcoidales bacterium]|nr:DUF502 domain-containing protein [Dehalococcoidales bacterium]